MHTIQRLEEQIEYSEKERHLEFEGIQAFFNEALLTYFSKKN